VDRTVLTRYYAFLVISQVSQPFGDQYICCDNDRVAHVLVSQFFVFSLLSVALNLITRIIGQVKEHKGATAILKGFDGQSGSGTYESLGTATDVPISRLCRSA
jgi:hypothetical protein